MKSYSLKILITLFCVAIVFSVINSILGTRCTLKSFCGFSKSVHIVTGYGLDDQDLGVQFLVGAGDISLPHHILTGSATHPASYPVDTRDSFPRSKVASV